MHGQYLRAILPEFSVICRFPEPLQCLKWSQPQHLTYWNKVLSQPESLVQVWWPQHIVSLRYEAENKTAFDRQQKNFARFFGILTCLIKDREATEDNYSSEEDGEEAKKNEDYNSDDGEDGEATERNDREDYYSGEDGSGAPSDIGKTR